MRINNKIKNVLMTIGITFAVLVLIVIVLSQIKITPYEIYKSEAGKFQMKYPAFWQVIDQPPSGPYVVFLSPLEHEMDVFQENVNITSSPVVGRLQSIDKVSKEIIKQLTGTFEGYVDVISAEKTTFAGKPGFEFVYVGKTPPNSTDIPLQFYHLWAMRGSQVVIFTYAAKQNSFEKNMKYIKTMAKSFEFTE